MSKNPKVTIGVILFKGEKYLKHSLTSLVNQDYKNIEFLFRDQSPDGEAYEYVKNEIPDVFSKVKLEKGGNLWHSGGHNALINQMKGDYYFCCSNDMLYESDFVSKCIKELEKPENKKFGSATVKLMKWDFEKAERGDLEGSKTRMIDSFGIGIAKNHHFHDIGSGETDQTPYFSLHRIFGPSGALAIFRKDALDEIEYKNEEGKIEYFDELLHYKNDVDLAYRLQWAGIPSLLIQSVNVYHDRQAGVFGHTNFNIINRLVSQAGKSKWVKANSFFGQLVVLKKNYYKGFSWEVKIKTGISRLIRFLYVLFFDANSLRQYKQVNKFRREINLKRKAMPRRVNASKIEELMT
ncbi:glycosyltransferase family 2 protein [Candidatus Peregrinibacteria bacterium]|nr:glycosyltransferase family 2 protein [Candidatus Peregrinibacteria bacterium]